MAELKCIEISCPKDAQYIDRGSSYCEAHYRKKQQEGLSVRWVYVVGLLLWILFWLWIFGWLGTRSLAEKILSIYSGSYWVLCIPMGLGFLVLVINLCLWWTPKDHADYITEVQVIEFVERNASWFLIASGAFLTAASFFLTRPPGAGTLPLPPLAREGLLAVLTFESLSLFCLFLVVLLYWIPPQPKQLALLRHLKTLPFTYGVSFFAGAFTTLVMAANS